MPALSPRFRARRPFGRRAAQPAAGAARGRLIRHPRGYATTGQHSGFSEKPPSSSGWGQPETLWWMREAPRPNSTKSGRLMPGEAPPPGAADGASRGPARTEGRPRRSPRTPSSRAFRSGRYVPGRTGAAATRGALRARGARTEAVPLPAPPAAPAPNGRRGPSALITAGGAGGGGTRPAAARAGRARHCVGPTWRWGEGWSVELGWGQRGPSWEVSGLCVVGGGDGGYAGRRRDLVAGALMLRFGSAPRRRDAQPRAPPLERERVR